ncbi:hypothetical protein HQ865_04610 [Mucilaginibacter mali]|uniref:Leucine-rich repeat domain-containing protein n=1 Tax=Mucilaginibacter mali TaxID=2740462 RepID=A0A7D4UJF8_9SPHI|nr:hypothetical protein [Mucilaginibacter mali]QKJ29062.1 hypothetical protein HQ865_04610 [Mucilaginibacter mali]
MSKLKNLEWLAIGKLPNLKWDTTFLILSKMNKLNKLSLFYNGFDRMPPGLLKLKKVSYFILNGNGFDEQEEERMKKLFPNAELSF